MKKIIESIYGMQYEELVENGKDGSSARFNGNLFVSAYIIVFILLIVVVCTHIPDYNDSMNRFFRNTFGNFNGKGLGKILAIPMLAGIYFVVKYTIGSEASFKKHIDAYKGYSEEEKKKSFGRILLPFLSMLGLMLVLAIAGLF